MTDDLPTRDATAFVQWMLDGVVAEARGDQMRTLTVAPSGRLWLGRLAPEVVVRNSRLGERSERLEPCEVGVRLRLSEVDGRMAQCSARLFVWHEIDGADDNDPDADRWAKSGPVEVAAQVQTPTSIGAVNRAGRSEFGAALAAIGASGLECELHAEMEVGKDGPEMVITLVNISPEELPGWDTNLYEVSLHVAAGPTQSFTLDNLPDSFRYDRTVDAYGVNGGVERVDQTTFRTTDVALYDQPRATYWDDAGGPEPDLRFTTLHDRPEPPLRELVEAARRWGAEHWSTDALERRADEEAWDDGMRQEAREQAERYAEEVDRLAAGLAHLETDDQVRRAFCLANSAFDRAHSIRHDRWRPFQIGFVLASIASIVDPSPDGERDVVDTLWFATGGGKTETYLLYVLTAAFHDRLRGKTEGITSWGRFPLRMLSLQQTQRFADVVVAADLVRRDERIGGAFSLGFMVGSNGTPNRLSTQPRAHEPDYRDPDMPLAIRFSCAVRSAGPTS